jgi:hypothetical protein
LEQVEWTCCAWLKKKGPQSRPKHTLMPFLLRPQEKMREVKRVVKMMDRNTVTSGLVRAPPFARTTLFNSAPFQLGTIRENLYMTFRLTIMHAAP